MSIHLPARPARSDMDVPWRELAGVRIGLVLWGGLAVVDLGRIAAVASYAEISVIALLVTLGSLGMRRPIGLGAAVVGWCVVNGFVEHRYGVLGYDPARDTALLLLFAGLSLIASDSRAVR